LLVVISRSVGVGGIEVIEFSSSFGGSVDVSEVFFNFSGDGV